MRGCRRPWPSCALQADGAEVHLAVVRDTSAAARLARSCTGLLIHGPLAAPEALATELLDYARRRRDGERHHDGQGPHLGLGPRDAGLLRGAGNDRAGKTRRSWRGTGFVEVVRDSRDGRHLLLEINPRLSGSIHLCLACGPNLAAGCCRVALGLPVQSAGGWPSGRRARRDLFHMVSARAWLPMRDPRSLPPYRILGEPRAFAAACAGRLRAGWPRPDQP